MKELNDSSQGRIANDGGIKSVLLIGQSNMAGRGDFGEVPEISHPRCLMMRNVRWIPMSEPVNPDRAIFNALFHSGVCLSASFAEAMAEANPDIKVGLIPCADGGTSLHDYAESDPLVAVASSEGLGSKPDGVHFSSAAQREFGRRYFAAYKTVARIETVGGVVP